MNSQEQKAALICSQTINSSFLAFVKIVIKLIIEPRHRGLGGKYSPKVFTWMRKVVGSNLDDALIQDASFTFADID